MLSSVNVRFQRLDRAMNEIGAVIDRFDLDPLGGREVGDLRPAFLLDAVDDMPAAFWPSRCSAMAAPPPSPWAVEFGNAAAPLSGPSSMRATSRSSTGRARPAS